MAEDISLNLKEKIDLSRLEVIAFREVVPQDEQIISKGQNMYPALAKLSCEYCASCHCATYS